MRSMLIQLFQSAEIRHCLPTAAAIKSPEPVCTQRLQCDGSGSPALRARISAARARPRSVAAAAAAAFWERVGASPPGS